MQKERNNNNKKIIDRQSKLKLKKEVSVTIFNCIK